MLVTCPDCATRYEVDDSAFSAGGRAVRCNHCGCEWYQIGPAAAPTANGAVASDSSPTDLAAHEAEDPIQAETLAENFGSLRRPSPRSSAGAETADRAQEPSYLVQGGSTRRPASAFDQPKIGDRLDAEIHLPAVVDSDPHEQAELRTVARGRAPARKSRRGGATLLIGALAAASVGGIYVYAPDLIPSGQEVATDRDPVNAVFASSTAAEAGQPGLVFVESKYDLVERPEGPALEIWGVVANNGPDDVLSPKIEIITRDENGKALQTWHAQPDIDVLPVGEDARFVSRMMFPIGPVHDVDFYLAN